MSDPTLTFKVGSETYDIPATKADAFKSKFPDAEELKSFVVGKILLIFHLLR